MTETETLAACFGKMAYRDRASADKSLQRQKRARPGKRLLNAYKCGGCGKWHIGNLPTSKGLR